MAQTNLEVGFGVAKGKDAGAVGKRAARQALEAIKEHPLSLVQVFASSHYDPEAVLRGVRQVVGPAPLIGASAAGGICNGVQRQAVVVLALASPYLRVKVAVGRGVSRDWDRAVIEAIADPEIAPYFSGGENVMESLLSRQGESAFALLFSPAAPRTADFHSFQILEADLLVLLTTGYSEANISARAQQIGIRQCLLKPLVLRHLGWTVRRQLDRKA